MPMIYILLRGSKLWQKLSTEQGYTWITFYKKWTFKILINNSVDSQTVSQHYKKILLLEGDMMNLEAKVDDIVKALVGIEAKLDQIIENQNVTSRPASLDRLQPKKTKKEIWLEEGLKEILWAKSQPLLWIKKVLQD